MPKLNRAQLDPRHNPAPPDNHLQFDDQRLDDLQAYYFGSDGAVPCPTEPTSEANVAESPMTKKLREEKKIQQASKRQSAQAEQVEARVLKRPSSGAMMSRHMALLYLHYH